MNPVLIAAGLGFVAGTALLGRRFFPRLLKLPPHKALVRTRAVNVPMADPKGVEVFFDSARVIPAFDVWEFVDLSAKTVKIERRQRDGIHCRDNLRADVSATFKLHIAKDKDAVLQIASEVGCQRLGEANTLNHLFVARFSAALKTVAKRYDFEELYEKRDIFQTEVAQSVGTHLSGYTLDGVYLDFLEQTELEFLDPDNIMDCEAITKITDRTATAHVETNRLRRSAEKIVAIEDHEHAKRQEQNLKQMNNRLSRVANLGG